MTTKSEDIQYLNLQKHSNIASGSHATDNIACDCWYIFRYKALSKSTKDYFRKNASEIFFPCRNIRKKDEETGSITYLEQPCVPGYIFVKGPLSRAQEIGNEVNIHPWMKPTVNHNGEAIAYPTSEHRCYSLSQKTMERFMEAVAHYQNGIKLYDPTDIDLLNDDEVEFIAGPLIGQRGHIRIEKGKAGGIVIVPLASSSLHLGFKAKPSEYRIVSFANNARHNDFIKLANAKAKTLLAAYCEGKPLSDKDRNKLNGYILRFAETETATNIQIAQLTLLLYRIYTILEDTAMCSKLKQRIATTVLPNYDQRIDEARGNRKIKISQQKDKFIQEIKNIETSPKRRAVSLTA